MARKKRGKPIHGWLNIDKDYEMGSTNVVGAVRRIMDAQKVGHAGTLDPMATGILPIALGEATKTVAYMQDADKDYSFTLKWGEATNTDDAEGEVIETSDVRPSLEDVEAVLSEFTGVIKQVPPQFSAIKVKGQRAYDIARRGDAAEIPARDVHVIKLDCVSCDGQSASFDVTCGKGTYIRSLARDIAKRLGSCAYVTVLRRTRVGYFSEKNAISLAELEKMVHNKPPEELVMPVTTALDDIPALLLTAEEATKLSHGQVIRFLSLQDCNRLKAIGVELGDYKGHILAVTKDKPLAITQLDGVILKSVRVLNL